MTFWCMGRCSNQLSHLARAGFSLAGLSAGSHNPAIEVLAELCSLVEPGILQVHVFGGRISCRCRTEGPPFLLSAGGNSQFLEVFP